MDDWPVSPSANSCIEQIYPGYARHLRPVYVVRMTNLIKKRTDGRSSLV